ncbi:Crp/Fnr family transcriptional regulator [Novosphingobium mangrovi (ex Huang et al. 2023)]|uniref:Crp/Fnr family transcriptional regulator n=1 Tax=Novosphingobium mangrovi (ex Huang et al. 2023) TaxID=2976432 RepID=A0ABT2I9N1_9SPHN|nr:Crp/Fnr family transcriptional regulator [Novosphingobium mangrovi (ex Huang et al. 2023)]MCT2401530.1 Crp/Fnr family transcriptional regulator [Novosphingobium mangrovi (ex Huang et al. 2023)]
MISAADVDTFLALGACRPFDRLTESELLLVSRHVHRRSHAGGEVVLPAGLAAERLVVVVGGTVLCGGRPAPAVFDAQSALFGLPVRADYVAAPEGVETLCLAKPHLFTIARECPDFIVGLAAERARDRA